MASRSNDVGEYRLLDSGNMKKLEQLGSYRIVRPSPQAIWEPKLNSHEWRRADATFTRSSNGGGQWEWHNKVKRDLDILYDTLFFHIQLTNFGHMGLFAEQVDNWNWIRQHIRNRMERTNNRNFNVLNLFAYTGGSSLAASQAGAHVVHVDASKGIIDWAKRNAKLCHLDQRPIRWLVDDAIKFANREIRREHTYQGIIFDPPTFGRGPKGEVFKIEKDLKELLESVKALLAKDALFVLYSCHTPGFTPVTMKNQLEVVINERQGNLESGEMLIIDQQGRALPSGVYGRWSSPDAQI